MKLKSLSVNILAILDRRITKERFSYLLNVEDSLHSLNVFQIHFVS